MDIFALAAKLTLDSSEYERGIEAAKNAANSFGQGLSAVVSAVTNTDNAVSNAADSTENFGQTAETAANGVGDMSDAAESVTQAVQHSSDSMEDAADSAESLSSSADEAAESVENVEDSATNTSQKMGLLDRTIGTLADGFNGLRQAGETVKKGFDTVHGAVDTVKTKFQSLTDGAKSLVDGGLSKIQSGIDNVRGKFSPLTSAAQNLIGVFSRTSDAAAENADAMEEGSKSADTLKNRIAMLQGVYDAAKAKVERLTDEFNKSAEETGATSDETKALAKELDKAEKEYQEAERDLKKYSDSTNDTTDSVKKLGDEESKATKKTSTFVDTLKGMLSAQALIAVFEKVTNAIVGFAKSSIEAGMNFDKSMSQVAATMGTTVDEIQDLRDFAQEMGRKTAFSATQAADALNYMALAGYDADTSMSMLPNVLNLAAAGSMDLAAASDMITDSQSALGLTLDETSQLVDKMAKASSKSNTSVSQLGEAILTVGGTAKNLAGGTTELSAALGILADNGTKGAEGGTKLRNIILSLGAPTDTAAKALNKLGVTAYDADGNMRPLQDTFSDLNKAMENMTTAEKTDIINTVFNKTDIKDVNALLATSADRWDELSSAIDDSTGAAQSMANTQLDNLAGDITLFQSALEGAQIAISDGLSPTLRQFVQFGSDGLSRLTESFKEDGLAGAMDTFGEILSEGIDKISAWLPKAVSIGTDLLLTIIDGLVSALPSLGTAAIEIITNLANGLAAAAPDLIPAAVEAVLGFAMALIEPDNISALIDSAIALIMGLADGIINALPILIDAAPDIIEALIEALIENAPKIIIASAELMLKLGEGIIDMIPELVMILPEVINAIYTAFKETDWKELGNYVMDGLKNGIGAKIVEITAKIRELGNAIKQKFCDFFGIHSPSTLMAELGGYIVDGLVNGIKNMPSKVIAIFTDLKSRITSWGSSAVSSIKSIGGNLVTGLWNGINDKVGWITNKISGFGNAVIDKIKGIFGVHSPSTVMKQIGDYLTQGLAIGVENGANEPIKAISSLSNDMTKAFDFRGIADTMSEISAINRPLSVKTSTTASENRTERLLNQILDVLYEIDRGMYDKIANAIDGMEIDWNDRELGRFVKSYA